MPSRADLLARVFKPSLGTFSRELAQHLLELQFLPRDQARYKKLSIKAQSGKLTPSEMIELDDYLNLNDFLMLLKAKARASQRRKHKTI